MEGITGKKLMEIWNIDVKHALYRENGDWYHLLKYFPAALFDKNGYIIFNTDEEYISSRYLQIGKELHVPEGIANIPEYIKIITNGSIEEITGEMLTENNDSFIESPRGNKIIQYKTASVERAVRDTKVSGWIKRLYGNRCQICGFTVELFNNEYYSEAHHILPLSCGGPDIVNNLLCVCPNHHVQLDYGAIKIAKEEILVKKGHNIIEEYIDYHNTKIYRI
jgi:5-methylcytosine-specific restriction protein A